MPYTQAQKVWFHERDLNCCQFPVWNKKRHKFGYCHTTDHLEVHHVYAQRMTLLWFGRIEDTPENGVLLCRKH